MSDVTQPLTKFYFAQFSMDDLYALGSALATKFTYNEGGRTLANLIRQVGRELERRGAIERGDVADEAEAVEVPIDMPIAEAAATIEMLVTLSLVGTTDRWRRLFAFMAVTLTRVIRHHAEQSAA